MTDAIMPEAAAVELRSILESSAFKVELYAGTELVASEQVAGVWLIGQSGIHLAGIKNYNWGYRLRTFGGKPAGPAGWWSFHFNVSTDSGESLHYPYELPAEVYAQPWHVPTVLRLPAVRAELPVYTVTFRMVGGRELARPETERDFHRDPDNQE